MLVFFFIRFFFFFYGLLRFNKSFFFSVHKFHIVLRYYHDTMEPKFIDKKPHFDGKCDELQFEQRSNDESKFDRRSNIIFHTCRLRL